MRISESVPTVFAAIWVFLLAVPLHAETANPSEAWEVADNYLRYLVDRFDPWESEDPPAIDTLEEVWHEGYHLGWVFHVSPQGFLFVARHKELAAVKAWSAHGRFDPESEVGSVAVVKDMYVRNLEAAQKITGRPADSINTEEWATLAGETFEESWTHPPSWKKVLENPRSGHAGMNYQEGEFLLSTHWHQSDPYNRQTPDIWVWDPDLQQMVLDCEHALVGCVATAGVQLMRYWSWPPSDVDGSYVDAYWWSRMTDIVTASSPQPVIDSVSAISSHIAHAVGMNFGCNESGSYTEDMEGVYDDRRYSSSVGKVSRYLAGMPFYTDEQWFGIMKEQFNQNRPIHYKVERHSIIGDGWYEVDIGGTVERWYHFTYGWNVADDTWYLMDVIPHGDPEIEYMLVDIFPDAVIGPTLSGYYPRGYGYGINHWDRSAYYFAQDLTGENADFQAGNGLQYARPGFWIRNTGTEADDIRFNGLPDEITEFYHEAPFGDVKVRIHDGALVLRGGGEMALY